MKLKSKAPRGKQKTVRRAASKGASRAASRTRPPGPRPATPYAEPVLPSRRARLLREDLVLQASLEAYGSIRQEGRLADRALDFTLRRKRNLWSAERRAVAERVYSLLRRERTIDFLLTHSRPRFTSLDVSRQ